MQRNRIGMSGVSSIIGGILYGFLGVAWAVTHGSTGFNRKGLWLGIDNLSYSKMNIGFVFLFIAGFWCLKHAANLASRKALIAYRAVLFSLWLQIAAQIMQYYIVNPLTNWLSPVISVGFLLHNVSWLLFIAGAVYLCVAMKEESYALRTLMALFPVSLIVLFGSSVVILPAYGEGTLFWDSFLAAIKFPFACCWIVYGMIMIVRSKNRNQF